LENRNTFSILFYGSTSRWQKKFFEAIAEEGHTPILEEDVDKAIHRLTLPSSEPNEIEAFIILDDEDMSLGEKFFQKIRSERGGAASGFSIRKIILATSLVKEQDQLKNIKDLGVTGFIFVEETVAQCVADLSKYLFQERRDTERFSVKYRTRVRFDTKKFAGTMVDISLKGAQVVMARDRQLEILKEGALISLQFVTSLFRIELECQATIKRMNKRKILFGERVSIGISFERMDVNFLRNIKRVLREAKMMNENRIRDIQMKLLSSNPVSGILPWH